MAKSKIEWTDVTWNPTTGCTKISEGCKNCYAEKMAKRLQLMGQKKYKNGFRLTLHEDSLNDPFLWKKNKLVFVNSMSDLFHEDIPFDFISSVFKVMNANPQHVFQVLTKRASILKEYGKFLNFTDNIWLGVSVEDQNTTSRVGLINDIKAKIKFVSIEPLIGEIININLDQINWVIVGGESGSGARPMKEEWVLYLKNLCLNREVPFFFKQWGGVRKKKNGRLLEGKEWNQFPLHGFNCF
ncbi:MAG: hypothetical protein CVU60_13115 [Deltaproteobacteria bacterium HGW-Deltaproteobacteria-18]|jgi:protein gp37|nr:MAG: hypothetical protein CVU60_13115 [Deltaproteobacteria bacterium HGW-Deltaproteobacteria-18]